MPVLRNVDVFVKARADIRTQSASGGLVTLMAASAAFLLFVCQICVYVFPNPTHTLHLSESNAFPMLFTTTHEYHRDGNSMNNNMNMNNIIDAYDAKGKVSLYFKITFLHLACESVDVMLNNEPIRGDDHSAWASRSSSTSSSSKKHPKKAAPDKNKQKRLTIKKYPTRPAELQTIFDTTKSNTPHGTSTNNLQGKGCTLIGNMKVPLVSGTLSIVMTRDAWSDALNYFMSRAHMSESAAKQQDQIHKNDFNTTHFVHEVRFGRKASASASAAAPLTNKMHHIENELNGVAFQQIQVKLIPTVHSNPGLLSRIFGTGNTPFYQTSVVEHTIKPETMISNGGGMSVLPGIAMSYDVTPLAVHINELEALEGGFFGFLSTLIGIVGGCFVTVGLFAGCAVKSVQAVTKKMD